MERLLHYIKAKGRICPRPDKWYELYEMLPDKKRNGFKCEPPLPLLRIFWWVSSDVQKKERLEDHVKYAAGHGHLDRVSRFIYELPYDKWVYEDASQPHSQRGGGI